MMQNGCINSHEEDLATIEEKLVTILLALDNEIQTLLTRCTEELEQMHKEALQAPAMEHA